MYQLTRETLYINFHKVTSIRVKMLKCYSFPSGSFQLRRWFHWEEVKNFFDAAFKIFGLHVLHHSWYIWSFTLPSVGDKLNWRTVDIWWRPIGPTEQGKQWRTKLCFSGVGVPSHLLLFLALLYKFNFIQLRKGFFFSKNVFKSCERFASWVSSEILWGEQPQELIMRGGVFIFSNRACTRIQT
jgi:hypothetical protein